MFGKWFQRQPQKSSTRGVRLSVEHLEERTVPHGGITEFASGITANAALGGIVQGPDGNFWFTEFAADRIGRITPAGVVTEFTLAAGRGPLNITVGPDNQLWFTENTGDRIGRINPLAGSDVAIQASIMETVVPGVGSAPNDIVAGPDGALWFTQTGSDEIGRITTAGTVTDEFMVPGVGSAPAGIAVGGDGNLWFTQAGSGQIGRVTTAGVFTEFNIPVPTNGVSDPEDIVVGPGGALFFTDFGRDQIGRIALDGTITQFNLPIGRGPQGIVASPDGDLYFTMAASGRIGRLPAASLIPGKPTAGSPPLEEFTFIPAGSVPLGITIDQNRDIWFTENAGNKIGFFQAHLNQLSLVATGNTAQLFDRNFNKVAEFIPFEGFQGGFRVAVNDMNDTGVPDAVVVAGPGGGSHVKVFEGSNNTLVASFFAFDPNFQGEVAIAAEDVNGDGRPDIIVGAAGHVKVIDGFKLNQVQANGVIADSALLASFFAFGSYRGPVSLAAVELTNDSRWDIIVGAGLGAPPHVKVIDSAKLDQVQPNGAIADSALLASFFAFDPGFTGGVFVAVGFNDVAKKIVVGAGPGGGPHVKVIDGTKLNQVLPNGQIADSALFANFFAFDPGFTGGVRVSADDLNSDAQSELILSAGPGAGPHVKVIDGTKLNQVLPNGQIADSALLRSFFSTPGFTGGVFIAADADHRDGPIFGPPGITITASQRDINDIYIFQSPVTATNSVLAMTVSPFSTATTPAVFVPGLLYDFRIANRDLTGVTDDLTFRVTFGPVGADGAQDVVLRALPAAKFAGSGGVLVKGLTNQNLAMRGVGGGGTAQFRAAEQDDPFIFDAAGFNRFLNGQGLSDGTTAAANMPPGTRPYPSGTSNNGAGDSDSDGLGFDGDAMSGSGEVPDYNAPNTFANANTLAIIFELPSTVIAGLPAGASLTPGMNAVGFWGRTELNGVQLDRMGRPAINTALIPPVPRGPSITNPAPDRRNEFNAGHPRDDRANFLNDMAGIIQNVYPIGAGDPGVSAAVASLLLPDILVYDPTSSAGFFQHTIGTFGQSDFFLAGGRKLSDDVVSIEVSILTDPDSPFNLDGGANAAPLIITQNVADDNGLGLRDGSVVGPGNPNAGMTRIAIFPYFGVPNANPASAPGSPLPP